MSERQATLVKVVIVYIRVERSLQGTSSQRKEN